MRSATFGPTPGARATIALSRIAIAVASSAGLQRREHRERDLGADALHGLQQAEPLALEVADEAEQPDLVLAHMRLDRERHRLALRRQRLQRARRAVHHVADAVHVDDDEVLAVAVDDALELADHRAATFSSTLARDARASPRWRARRRRRRICGSAFGSSTPTIMRICAFSAWPAPTMVFFTRFGAYSATGTPAFAGTSSAMPRAWPSFSVAAASWLTKVASTAASSGRNSSTIRVSPSWIVPAARRGSSLLVGLDRAAGDVDQPVALDPITPQPVRRSPGSMPRMRIAVPSRP